jgi:hypothetical protein
MPKRNPTGGVSGQLNFTWHAFLTCESLDLSRGFPSFSVTLKTRPTLFSGLFDPAGAKSARRGKNRQGWRKPLETRGKPPLLL